MMRRVLCILCVLALLLALAACASDTPKEKTMEAATAEKTTEAAPVEKTTEAAPAETTTEAAPAETTEAAPAEKTTEELLKELLAHMEPETFDENDLVLTIKQKYSLETHTDNQEEKTDSILTYEGEGSFTRVTELPGPENGQEETDFYELIQKGSGYFKNVQEEKFSLQGMEFYKADNESRNLAEEYAIRQEVLIRYDEKDFYAASQTDYQNPLEPGAHEKESFAGRIHKETLLNSLSSRSVNGFMNKLFFLDGYSLATLINDYSESFFLDDKLFGQADLEAFIRENQVEAREQDGLILVDFSYEADRLSQFMELETAGEQARITGRMEFDPASGELLRFSYDLKDYVARQMNAMAPEGTAVTATVNYYTVEGEVLKMSSGEIPLEGDFESYEEAGLFIEKLGGQIAPMDD